MVLTEMTLQILYFAGLRDLVGTAKETIEVDDSIHSVEALLNDLQERHSTLRLDGVRIAVNEEFQPLEASISQGDVIALIPPVSGG